MRDIWGVDNEVSEFDIVESSDDSTVSWGLFINMVNFNTSIDK